MKAYSFVVYLPVVWFGIIRGAAGTSSTGTVSPLPSTAPNDCNCHCLCPFHLFNLPPAIIANTSATGVALESVPSMPPTAVSPAESSAMQQYESLTQIDGSSSMSLATPWPPESGSPTSSSQQETTSGSQPPAPTSSETTSNVESEAPAPTSSESDATPSSDRPAPTESTPPESVTTPGPATPAPATTTTTTGLDVNSVPLYSALTLKLGG